MANIDSERLSGNGLVSEHTPLLPSDRHHISLLRNSRDIIACHIVKIHGEDTWVWRLRHRLQDFLTSKWGHYFVIFLVSMDVGCIFANFLISLHMCEHKQDPAFDKKAWSIADNVLDYVSLAFSSLFMAELLGSIFAFGFSYFESKFHIFDATVIVAAFIIDVLLHGVIEEAGSLIILLRLWRIFKIIEEFSTGAEDEMGGLREHITQLESEKRRMSEENNSLRKRLNANASDGI